MQANAAPLDRVTLKIFRNFERSFTPRTWLRSAQNFGKNVFQTISNVSFFDAGNLLFIPQTMELAECTGSYFVSKSITN